jgi:CBS domain-containing protein
VRNADIPLDECAQCERSFGLRIGPRRSQIAVYCDTETDEASSEPSRGACVARRPSVATQAELTPISEIMTTHVVCVGPRLRVAVLRELLLARGIAGVPVVDDAGCPVGFVSKTDLVRAHSAGTSFADTVTVDEIMAPKAFCLPANESVAKAAALMTFERIHRVPILGPHGQVIGILSSSDVLRWVARQSGFVVGTSS